MHTESYPKYFVYPEVIAEKAGLNVGSIGVFREYQDVALLQDTDFIDALVIGGRTRQYGSSVSYSLRSRYFVQTYGFEHGHFLKKHMAINSNEHRRIMEVHVPDYIFKEMQEERIKKKIPEFFKGGSMDVIPLSFMLDFLYKYMRRRNCLED
jgi:hypothetical protein